jgi:hypothetical protein
MNDDKTQLDRFKEAAREVGADESDDALDKIMRKLDLTKKPDGEKKPAGGKDD